ncbi:FG-GAP-like repeat-containing protein [Thiobacillus sp.]
MNRILIASRRLNQSLCPRTAWEAFMRGSGVAFFLASIFFGIGTASAATVPGAIPGSFDVSETGAATYSIPIAVPPGTAGMEPKLSLNYSSQSGNGIAGVGWSIGGLSAITRCPQTIVQDGQTRGVQLDAYDRFCLDGQRLIVINGATYGAPGAEYRTEIESFSKVVSIGGTAGDPQSFKVWTKAGQIIEFGNTIDSRVEAQGKPIAAVWTVNKISDTVGNYIAFTYFEDNANGEHRITRIDYTGNAAASVSPYNSVEFQYETRPDTSTGYLAGSLKQETQRLASIQTKAGGALVLDHQLVYEVGATTGHSRLLSLSQCSANGDCLAPTTFSWQEGAALGYETSAAERSLATGTMADIWFALGDANADGRIDAVAVKRSPMTFYSALGDSTGFNAPTTVALGWGMIGTTNYGRFYLADFDGDGRSDPALCAYETWNLGGGFLINKAFKLSWKTQLDGQFGAQTNVEEVYKPDPTNEAIALRQWCMPAELNGDGRADTVWYAGTWQQRFLLGLSTGDGYNLRQNGQETSGSVTYFYGWPYHRLGAPSLTAASVNTTTSWFFPVDVNGDGRTDAARIDAASGSLNLWTTNSDGKSYTTLSSVPMVAGSAPQSRWYTMADINGDGLADVILHDPANGKLSAWIAKGNGAFGAQVDTVVFDTGGVLADTWFMAADVNHDGRADVIKYKPATGLFLYALSLGNGEFGPSQQLNIGAGKKPSEGWFDLADINGDGKSDVVRYDPATGKLSVNFVLGPLPDQLLSITDGHGATRSITYKPLTDPTIYTKGTGATYPVQDVQNATYVVSETAADDGIGGQYHMTYRYAGARTHLTGRGFLGFATLEQTDLQTGIVTRTDYRQDFPYIGQPTLVTKTSAGGVALDRVENTYAEKTIVGAGRFPYLAYTKEQSKDLNAAVLPLSETWNTYGDDWGNLTKTIIQTSDGFKKQTDSVYTNDGTNWLLGRLTRATVTSSVNSGSWTQSRVSAFEYDAVTGLLKKETIEPDQPQFRLDTAYAFDAFGNRSGVTLSSPATGTAAIVTRTTTTGYDAKGQFPATVTNALGHTETRVIDPRFGGVTRLTGPNNLTTTWQYDGFGRKTRETRADGTYTVWTHAACDAACPGWGAYRIVTQAYAADSTQAAPASVVYFDRLNREVRTATQGLDSRWIYTDTIYDTRGNAGKVSRPYYVGDTVYWIDRSFDDLNRLVQVIEPDNLAKPALIADYNGLTITRTNRKDQVTVETRNSQGQKVTVTDALAQTTLYHYDPFGNLTRTTDPAGNQIVNLYDIRGRKTQTADPDLGLWKYEYNALGGLTKQTDAKQQATTFVYDKLGRMTQRVEPGLTSTWTWDSAAYGKGKLQSAKTSAGYIRSHWYDDKGRPQLTLSNLGAGNPLFFTSVAYDAAGRVSEQYLPGGVATKRIYNSLGYETELRNSNGNVLYWRLNAIDAEGHTIQETYGNGTAVYTAYLPTNGRFNYRIDNRNGIWIDYYYQDYDDLGNINSRYHMGGGGGDNLTYDGLNRLTQTERFGNAAGIDTIVYTPGGNITSKTSVGAYYYGGSPNCINNNVGPHAVCRAGTNAYSYDANGNLTGGGGRSLTWTAWNMPASLTQGGQTTTWLYGPEHDRYKMIAPGRTTWYLNPGIHQGGHYEQTLYANDTYESRTTLYGGGRPIGEIVGFDASPNQVRYFHSDAQGSITAVTDSSGAVLTRYRYDPWGKQTLVAGSNTGIAQTRQGHTGHEMLDGGLTHMNGRLFDPVLARFVSADPNINDEYNLQSLNRYSYVLNNPLYYTDPTGFMEFSDGGSWGGGSVFSMSGGSSSGFSFSFGASSSWGGSSSSGGSSSFFSSGGTGVSQSSIGSSGFYSNSTSLTGNGLGLSSYSGQSLLSGSWGGNGRSANAYSWSGSSFGNGGRDPTYSSVLSSRSTMDGVGRTQGEIWAAQGASRNLAMGFMPGYDLYQATQNGNAGFADYAVGILGIAPGFGKGAGLGLRGLEEGWNAAKGGGQVFERVLSNAELRATQETGLLRGGRSGENFFTDAASLDAKRAQQRLGLDGPLRDQRIQFQIKNDVTVSGPRTAPGGRSGTSGGGREFSTNEPTQIEILRIDALRR